MIRPPPRSTLFPSTTLFRSAGDRVELDEPLFELSTDKVDTDVPSSAAGVLKSIFVAEGDRKSTRLNSSHLVISYAVFCLKKKKNTSDQLVCKLQPRSASSQFSRLISTSLFVELLLSLFFFFFFLNDPAPPEIYPLPLHDALPICRRPRRARRAVVRAVDRQGGHRRPFISRGRPEVDLRRGRRSEEHTSELQSPCNLVCRLLLEKKKKHIRPTRLQATTT